MRFSRRNVLALGAALGARLSVGAATAAPTRDLSEFGAKYGQDDAAEALRAAAQWANESGGAIRVSGRAALKTPVTLGGRVALVGEGAAASFACAPMAEPALQFAKGTLRLQGLSIQGVEEQLSRPFALIRAAGLTHFELIGCRVGGHRAGLVGVFGCARVTMSGNTFEKWGVREPTKQGGPAVHLAAKRDSGEPTHEVAIEGNTFQNGEWVALSVYAQNTKIRNNRMRDIKESGIFAFRHRRGDLASDAAAELEISGNVIEGVARKDVSATGMEIGADRFSIRDNQVRETESSGIKVLDPSLHASIVGNRVVGTVRRPDVFRNHGQIQVQSHSTTLDSPVDVHIENNVVSDTRSPPTAPYAFSCPTHPGWAPVRDLVVRNNDFRSGYSLAAINLPPDERGAGYTEAANRS